MKNVWVRNIVIGIALLVLVSFSVVAYISSKNSSGSVLAQSDTVIKQKTTSTAAAPTPSPAANSSISATGSPDQQNKTTSAPVKVKGLYLTGWTVGIPADLKHYVDLANSTEINSYVVDIKDDDGYVGYQSNVPAVKENKAWQSKYDVDKVIKAFHDNNIHVIGRIVSFKDPVLSAKRPDLAVKRADGSAWKDNNGLTWLNPYNQESWDYIIQIAKEAVSKGFDEIQFDYVRFPNDGAKSAMNFGDTSIKKYEAIDGFLDYARKELPGVTLSADVFGIICESPGDTEQIGQNLEYVGKNLDYISPMAYPSHYALGQIVNKVKFPKPDLDPYNVVYNTLIKAKDRISKVDGYKASLRPYLQDFTASWVGKGNYQHYGDEQVAQQIKAVYDAGYDQWILWNANNSYSELALQNEK